MSRVKWEAFHQTANGRKSNLGNDVPVVTTRAGVVEGRSDGSDGLKPCGLQIPV